MQLEKKSDQQFTAWKKVIAKTKTSGSW